MDGKYQQYYNALNGKEFNSYISKYTSTLNLVRSKLSSLETIMSGSWQEQGLEYIKSTIIPNLKKQEVNIEEGVSILSGVVSKVSSLVGKLSELQSACSAYASCDEEQKSSYLSRINSLESQIDSMINEINSTSLEIEDAKASVTASMTDLESLSDIQAKKAAFLGDVNDASSYYVDPNYATKAKELLCFDNTTGQILKEGDVLKLKPGETRILTVKLPNNAGQIKQLVRTTADGNDLYRTGSVVTAKSDVNPDSNVIDYVNYKFGNHWPQGVDLHTNHYDWIITANSAGEVEISQTCEYTNTNGDTPKGMISLNVQVA